jgi:hypothetical protein
MGVMSDTLPREVATTTAGVMSETLPRWQRALRHHVRKCCRGMWQRLLAGRPRHCRDGNGRFGVTSETLPRDCVTTLLAGVMSETLP